MKYGFFIVFYCFCLLQVSAKLYNNFDQNVSQYGQPIEIRDFNSKLGFTGYVTYSIDKSWRLKAFFVDNKCRMEHLLSQPGENPVINREQAKNWALKMFEQKDRGTYAKEVNMPKVMGHFFQKGLIAYERAFRGRSEIGFNAVKVSVYEGNKSYSKAINPRAYL